ncbi:TetR/AcrR family transcriptional regulator [Spiractinospora alimapuensis]|uniref:TetR/AcrR family transcriptional regulator n=1 Tax=Spiractinospora alimapuensis TaxID=2820884 RepID=UPI001F43039A|nr:TetR/AcrR family transcriptional regulator [Spiractinospora alimapuensis]QVQ53748.1 TetR/AcrR family transcriptional regulator [Spiractinospora alimapuensis]
MRETRAAQTRAEITAAARELFESGGFAKTTIAAIAEKAGVSAQTVYAAFGSKAEVLRAIVEQMEESADAEMWRGRVAEESDPRAVLRACAEWVRAFYSASMPQLLVAREVTAEMREMAAEGDARRRAGLVPLIDRLVGEGAIRRDLSTADAVDRAWLLTSLDIYLNATTTCGWSPEAYASWLADALAQQLLEPPGSSEAPSSGG